MIPRPLDNDFAEWAFGAQLWFDFLNWEKDHIDLLHAWNDRHGELYQCDGGECIKESLKIMKQLYQEHKDDNPKAKVRAKGAGANKTSKRGTKDSSHIGMGIDENTNKVKQIRGTNGQENAQSNRVNEKGREGNQGRRESQ